MKKSICITVNVDTFILAQEKLGKGNISSYLNECLESLANSKENRNIENAEEKINEISNNITSLLMEKNLLINKIEQTKKEEQRQKEIEKEREKFKRWVCPVCKAMNYLDSFTCSKCDMRTRNFNPALQGRALP